jgi:Myb-like DNA-binding domain/Zinc finger, ZZ type
VDPIASTHYTRITTYINPSHLKMPVRRGRKGKQGTAGSKQASSAANNAVVLSVSLPVNHASSSSDAPHDEATLPSDTDAEVKHHQLVLTSDKRRGVYECDYCGADVSQTPRIRCAVCVDFDVCLDCFLLPSKTAQLRQEASARHDPATHGYRVCDSTRYPLFPANSATGGTALVSKAKKKTNDFASGAGGGTSSVTESVEDVTACSTDKNTEVDPSSDYGQGMDGVDFYEKPKDSTEEATGADQTVSAAPTIVLGDDTKSLLWTAEEDLRLLCGIQTHGLGNWSDISEAVAGQGSQGKTPKRCMERYFDDFMGRYGHILPPFTLISEASTTGALPMEDAATDEEVMENSAASVAGVNATVEADPSLPTTPLEMPTPTKDTNVPPPTSGDVTALGESVRSSKRRSTMCRSASSAGLLAASAKRYIAVPTESLPEYPQQKRFLPILDSGPVVLGQEVGRDAATKAEQAYVRAIASLDRPEEVERVRLDWEQNRLNHPGGPTVLPMRPDDIPKLPGSELSGFMPRRGDFDVEFENGAEDAIADMEFIAGESEQDRALKLSVLAIYNSKLDEREKRKKFILSRRLYDYRSYQEEYKKLPRDERDLLLRMRLLERFHTPEEHQIFIQDLLKAKRLRKEIAKLQMYHRMGIRTLLEAERYELDKARRLFHKNAMEEKAAMKLATPSTSGVVPSVAAPSADTAKTVLSSKDMAEASSSLYWKQYRTTDRKVRRSVNRGSLAAHDDLMDDHTAVSLIVPTAAVVESTRMDIQESTPVNADALDVEKAAVGQRTLTTADTQDGSAFPKEGAKDATKSTLVHEDLSYLPGYDLLSSRELDLVRSICTTPEQYLQIKKALISESLMLGLLDDEESSVAMTTNPSRKACPTAPHTLVLMDVERRGKIVDFVVQAGWVPTEFGKTTGRGIFTSRGSEL